jgi:hypothetical protein
MTRKTTTLLAGLASLAALGSPPDAAAQQQTFRACYVPQVGAMYLLGLPGLPSECLSNEHEEISWTEGSSTGEGSVGTAALADGAVTTDKLADGAVTAAKLAAGSVGATHIEQGSVNRDHIGPDAVGLDELGDRSVGSEELRFGAIGSELHFDEGVVTSTAIRDAGVRSPDIADGAVAARHLAPGAVYGERLALQIQVIDQEGTVLGFEVVTPTMSCPAGLEHLTAGFFFASPSVQVRGSSPWGPAGMQGWVFRIENTGAVAADYTLRLVCADLS